jgi:hypothetical protein
MSEVEEQLLLGINIIQRNQRHLIAKHSQWPKTMAIGALTLLFILPGLLFLFLYSRPGALTILSRFPLELIAVSLDGARPSYLDLGLTPTLDILSKRGTFGFLCP